MIPVLFSFSSNKSKKKKNNFKKQDIHKPKAKDIHQSNSEPSLVLHRPQTNIQILTTIKTKQKRPTPHQTKSIKTDYRNQLNLSKKTQQLNKPNAKAKLLQRNN